HTRFSRDWSSDVCSSDLVGGMIEFGVSKAHNLALASLPEIILPGDFSDSHHFWEEDIVVPEIHVDNGEVALSAENGIGYEVKLRSEERRVGKSVGVGGSR